VTRFFRPHYDSGVDSTANRNEYQGCLLGVKGGRGVGLTILPPTCADCLEIWELQPPGNLRVCPGQYWVCFTLNISSYQSALIFFRLLQNYPV